MPNNKIGFLIKNKNPGIDNKKVNKEISNRDLNLNLTKYSKNMKRKKNA